MYKLHTRCRACGFGPPIVAEGIKIEKSQEHLVPVMDLGIQPLANDFKKPEEGHAGFAPLRVLFCPKCGLGQLSAVVDPMILYDNYAYVTSPSETMRKHFDALLYDIGLETEGKRLLEIGCNDGRLLCHFRDKGFDVYGIDPADNMVGKCRESELTVVCGFFGVGSRGWLVTQKLADIVLARHVFCHVDNWFSFVDELDSVTNINSLICIEVPWAADQIGMGSFDTIYHEHLSYFTLRSMDALLKGTDWHIHRVIHYSIHGGAILVMLRHNQHEVWGSQRHASVDGMLATENITVESWNDLDQKRMGLVAKIQNLVRELRYKGKRVVAYGASAKCTVWMNLCGFSKRDIDFVCDGTKEKQYRFVPGTDIPVVDEGALTRELPDYAFLTAWNFRPEIISKEKLFKERGGSWIVPIPELRVI